MFHKKEQGIIIVSVATIQYLKRQAQTAFKQEGFKSQKRLEITSILSELEKMPDSDPNYQVYQAYVYSHIGQKEQSSIHLAAAEKAHDRNVDVLGTLALIHHQNGNAQKAEECLLKALKIDPKNTETLHGLSAFQHKQGNDVKAEEYLLQALELEPENPHLLHALSTLYFTQGPQGGYAASWTANEAARDIVAKEEDRDKYKNLSKQILDQKKLILRHYDPVSDTYGSNRPGSPGDDLTPRP
jgi:tetratricopeptide (TPR) repeat protein